jgi:hypothetical protein
MNFAPLWARNCGRATPSLRCTPKAPTKETQQEATYFQREVVQTTEANCVSNPRISPFSAMSHFLFFCPMY